MPLSAGGGTIAGGASRPGATGARAGGFSMRTSLAGGSLADGFGIFLGGVVMVSPTFGITVVPPLAQPLLAHGSQQPLS